ncbi:MAG: NAD(P)-dependent oxidoreductase [Oscillospiraceae bacterium]|nr:NAD(P)-dependent oxidoreductase [Oscillospiraceae bacterium]
MKTVLITGASGLMGSELALALLEKGFNVVGVDNTPGAGTDNPNYTFVQAAVDNKDAVIRAMNENNIDALVHLACTVDNDLPNVITSAHEKQSAAVDKYLYKSAIAAGASDVILVSTHQVYASQKSREPIRETADEKPTTAYGKMKYESEKAMAKEIKKASSAKGVIARVCPIYTKDYAPNLHARIFDPKDSCSYIYGYGDYGFSFCCLFNLVDFIIGILTVSGGINYQGVYNVCDSKPILAKEIVEFERQYHKLGAVIQRNYGSDAVKSALAFGSKNAKIDYRYNDLSTVCSNISYDNTKAQRISTFRWKLSNTK